MENILESLTAKMELQSRSRHDRNQVLEENSLQGYVVDNSDQDFSGIFELVEHAVEREVPQSNWQSEEVAIPVEINAAEMQVSSYFHTKYYIIY